MELGKRILMSVMRFGSSWELGAGGWESGARRIVGREARF